jgi:hypothetical protein
MPGMSVRSETEDTLFVADFLQIVRQLEDVGEVLRRTTSRHVYGSCRPQSREIPAGNSISNSTVARRELLT